MPVQLKPETIMSLPSARNILRLHEAVLNLDVVALVSLAESLAPIQRATLFNHRLDVDDSCAEWWFCTPLAYAIVRGSQPVVQCLLERCSADIRLAPCLPHFPSSSSEPPSTPLHLAAVLFVKPSLVRTLLDAGSSIADIAPHRMFPVLHYAVNCSSNVGVAEDLLNDAVRSLGPEAVVNARDDFERTVLHVAVMSAIISLSPAVISGSSKDSAVIRKSFFDKIFDVLLINIGLRVDDSDRTGKTALMYASKANCRPVVVRLLAAGASPIAVNKSGRSSLYFAVISSVSILIIEDLIKAGADPTARDRLDQSPIDHAIIKLTGCSRRDGSQHQRYLPRQPSTSSTQLISTLMSLIDRLNLLVHYSSSTKKLVLWPVAFARTVRLLISLLPPTSGNIDYDCSSLGHDTLYRLVSDNKEFVGDKYSEDSGSTVLQCAAAAGHVRLVEILLGDVYQLPVDETDNAGWTALHYALAEAGTASEVEPEVLSRCKAESASVLIGAGANVNTRTDDKFCWTPLWLSMLNGHYKLAYQLLNSGADVTATLSLRQVLTSSKAVFEYVSEPEMDETGRKTVIEDSLRLVTPLEYALRVGEWKCACDIAWKSVERCCMRTTTGNNMASLMKLLPEKWEEIDRTNECDDLRVLREALQHTCTRL